jgi:hypothetical protein
VGKNGAFAVRLAALIALLLAPLAASAAPGDAVTIPAAAFEPGWNSAVASLQSRSPDMRDKLHLAGYWAQLLICTPTWKRVAVEMNNNNVINTVRGNSDFFTVAARRPRRLRTKSAHCGAGYQPPPKL